MGITLLELNCGIRKNNINEEDERLKIANFLISKGIYGEWMGGRGSRNGEGEREYSYYFLVVKILFFLGADVNLANYVNGFTPLL